MEIRIRKKEKKKLQTIRWKNRNIQERKIPFPIGKSQKVKSISELCIKERDSVIRKEGYVCSFNFQKWTCFRDYYATISKAKVSLSRMYRKMEAQKKTEQKRSLIFDNLSMMGFFVCLFLE